jgi:isopropylmalate/homocitrate/citramalate synthase
MKENKMYAIRNNSNYLPLYNTLHQLSDASMKYIHPQIKLFDVTLRDGLQTQNNIYDVTQKYKLYKNIIKKYNPHSIEIGSIVNEKILPQLANTIELFKYIENQDYDTVKPKLYVLTPNSTSLKKAMDNNIMNFSFITSVSDAFQIKNTNNTLIETRNLLKDMFMIVKKSEKKSHDVKLYISCIDECPISGRVYLEDIIEEIMYYYVNHSNIIDELCLSDTCGTLKYDRFKIIIDTLLEYYKINPEKLSLHLHVSKNDTTKVASIIQYALSKDIYKFDVCCFENMGGCSVTMDKKNINGNLTYNQLNAILD